MYPMNHRIMGRLMSEGIRRVACAISGGVDSAVAAYLLKQKGYEVVGVFMKNWDETDETGRCSSDQDREDADYVCRQLHIPFVEVNFVREYWNEVFSRMISGYENGTTPNPDVLCNRYIKFGSFFNHIFREVDADAVATGHYAQNSAGNYLEHIQSSSGARLMMAEDRWKDQTLFLAQISQASLKKTMFPIGSLLKREVKQIALSLAMDRIVQKKESTGICFVGKRNFHKFIEEYITPKPGVFVNIDTGEIMGHHKGTHYWTVGQRSRISGREKAFYIVKVNPTTQQILVAGDHDHTSLYCNTMYTDIPHWICDPPPQLLQHQASYHCGFKFQHVHHTSTCSLEMCGDSRKLKVTLPTPIRALTKGQYATFYRDNECLGSARISELGPSLYDLGLQVNEVVKDISYEVQNS